MQATNTTTDLQPTPESFWIPMWAIYAIIGIIVFLVVVYLYRKRDTIRYYYNMMRGRATEEQYLVYEGDEYDEKNAPKREKKSERFGQIEMAIIIGSYIFVLPSLIIIPLLGFVLIGIVVTITGSMEIWRRLMAYYEVKKYGPSMHLKLYYQDLDGMEGELFLDNIVVSDRLTVTPQELITAADAAEHVIKSGIDENRLTAKSAKEYLSASVISKLNELSQLSVKRDQSVLESVSAMDFLRKYFDLEEADPEETIPIEVRRTLDAIREGILANPLPESLSKKERSKLPTLKIYPGESISIPKEIETQSKDGKKGTEQKEIVMQKIDPSRYLDPAEIVYSWFDAEGNWQHLRDLSMFKEGYVTKSMKKHLDKLYEQAKAIDKANREILLKTDLVKRYFGISIPYWSGQADIIKKYNPHIYTIYPNSDLKRRCCIVFAVPFGEAIKKDSKIYVSFDYTGFAGIGGTIEAVKIGTVREALIEGAEIQGVEVRLPEEMFAVETDIPLFVATAYDYTDELARNGLRATRPPAEIDMFTQVVKSLTDIKSVLKRYGRALRKIQRLEEEDKMDQIDRETEDAERELDMGTLIDPSKLPKQTEYVEAPTAVSKLALVLLAGVIVGVLAMIFGIAILGYAICNPTTGEILFGGSFNYFDWITKSSQIMNTGDLLT